MGKHEREDIELMERSVVRLLMSQKPLIGSGHKWFKHMLAFADFIKKNYPSFRKAEHIGNKYGGLRGDIKLNKKDESIEYIELKASETKLGRGTLANISQNAITDYNLLVKEKENGILSWSEFRKKRKFKKLVEELLDEYDYPRELNFEEKARYVKKRAESGDKIAKIIKRYIFKLARQNKKKYINYIKQFPVNEENLKKFLFCILNGIHVKKDILDFMNETKVKDLKRITALITTLYGNVKGEKIAIKKEKNKMGALLGKYKNFEFTFPEESQEVVYTYLSCTKRGQIKKRINVLGLVFHWKNIFQGIKTPCINVFLGSDYQSI